jgi:hypothetical protein
MGGTPNWPWIKEKRGRPGKDYYFWVIFKNKFDRFQDNLNDFIKSQTGIGRRLRKQKWLPRLGRKRGKTRKGVNFLTIGPAFGRNKGSMGDLLNDMGK